MMDSLRRMMYFGLGAAAMSADIIRRTIDEFVERGEMTTDEGKKLYDDVMTRAEEERRSMNERMRSHVHDVLKDMGVADRTQVAMLENRIDAIHANIEEMERRLAEISARLPVAEKA